MPPRQRNDDRDTGRGPSTSGWSQDDSARLSRVERMLIILIGRSITLENQMAIDFTSTTAALTKLQGAEAVTQKLVDDMNAKLAELSSTITNPEDQARVEAFAAAFAAEADKLPKAAAAPPNAGASAGGTTG